MDQKPPPSPAASSHSDGFDGLPRGFDQLVQSAEPTSFPQHLASQPGSRYGTPVPHGGYYEPAASYPPGVNFIYPQPFSDEPSPYGPLPGEPGAHLLQYNPNALTPDASPPTPSQRSDVISLRSGTISRAASASKALSGVKSGRVEKPPPPSRRKKKEKAKDPSVPELDKPLSELTRDWSHIPVVDIEAYVNRPTEVRRQEVEQGKVPGKVKRPMNAFMLYRKAYQNRTKNWCMQHNHQIVSKVCGASWPLEPEDLRQQYKDWAELETINHKKAHPGYKFTPSKPRKKPEGDEFDDGPESDLEDYEWAARRGGGRSRTTALSEDPDGDYQPPRSSYGAAGPAHHHHHHYASPMAGGVSMPTRSTFQYSNPGKPLPVPYEQGDLLGAYYQQNLQPGMQPGVQDVLIHKVPSPNLSFHGGGQMADPGYELVGPGSGGAGSAYHQVPAGLQPYDDQLNHGLLPQDGGGGLYDPYLLNGSLDAQLEGQTWAMPLGMEGATPQPQQYQEPFQGLDATLLDEQQQKQLLRGMEGDWKIEHLSEADQFDNTWMGAPTTEA